MLLNKYNLQIQTTTLINEKTISRKGKAKRLFKKILNATDSNNPEDIGELKKWIDSKKLEKKKRLYLTILFLKIFSIFILVSLCGLINMIC